MKLLPHGSIVDCINDKVLILHFNTTPEMNFLKFKTSVLFFIFSGKELNRRVAISTLLSIESSLALQYSEPSKDKKISYLVNNR